MEKYTPLQEKAYQYLKEEILKGRFQYGKFYSETKIAAETGLSRTPIKDALTRLCHAKYVDIVPSKGFCLHKITKDDIKNSYELLAIPVLVLTPLPPLSNTSNELFLSSNNANEFPNIGVQSLKTLVGFSFIRIVLANGDIVTFSTLILCFISIFSLL